MLSYDALAGVAPSEAIDDAPDVTPEVPAKTTTRRRASTSRSRASKATAVAEVAEADAPQAEEVSVAEPPVATEPVEEPAAPTRTAKGKTAKLTDQQTQLRAGAGQLLQRALRLGHDNDEDAEWLDSSAVKNQLLRMDPAFNEKEFGYASFSDFADSFKFVELDATHQTRRLRLRRR
jgi:hypothetical protein